MVQTKYKMHLRFESKRSLKFQIQKGISPSTYAQYPSMQATCPGPPQNSPASHQSQTLEDKPNIFFPEYDRKSPQKVTVKMGQCRALNP